MRRKADRLSVAAFVVGYPTLLRVNELAMENREQTEQIVAEGRERRDQMCRLFEGQHRSDVERLRRTYDYLGRLPRSEYGTPLTVAVVTGLADIERDARADRAPPFCDAPNTGLPEPDPEVPARQDFRHVLRRP